MSRGLVDLFRRSRWVRPDTHEVVKFLPSNPPSRGDIVLVDGERCRVLRSKVRWDGPRWEIYGRGIKVTPA